MSGHRARFRGYDNCCSEFPEPQVRRAFSPGKKRRASLRAAMHQNVMLQLLSVP